MAMCCLCLVISCNDDKESIIPTVEDSVEKVTVENGRIKFATQDDFADFMNANVSGNDVDVYAKKIRQFEKLGFASYSFKNVSFDGRVYSADTDSLSYNEDGDFEEFENDEDVDFICDPYFAGILNTDNELQIGDFIYRYTHFGMFYTSSDNVEAMEDFIAATDTSYYSTLPAEEETEVACDIYYYRFNYEQSISIEDIYLDEEENEVAMNNAKGTLKKAVNYDNKPTPSSLKQCGDMKNTLLTKALGPSIHCYDNFSSKKRIHVKVWNQNYRVYSSLGLNVRCQQKRLGVWFAKKIDELELGYAFATFVYPGENFSFPDKSEFLTNYNGVKIDPRGRTVFYDCGITSFPIKDKDKKEFTIYVRNPFNGNTLTQKSIDIYNVIEWLEKKAINAIWDYSQEKLTKKPTLIISNDANNDLEFTYAYWSKNKRNENKISEVLDWNTGQIGIRFGGDGKAKFNGSKLFTAQTYKNARILCYGMGRDGDTWRGAQVDFKDGE
ncbi:MAG: hypothetical protein J6U04_10620 [Salinivirgaceae bacterium]|nr:hypothetical protein [Salinivirgaceae bacterium]